MKLCVFLSANHTTNQNIHSACASLGKGIAERKHTLVYGGAKVGLMNILANAAMDQGGEVIGVISKEFNKIEVLNDRIAPNNLFVMEDMTGRIQKQIEISDAFIIFPGGIGTLDEFFKVLVLKKIGLLEDKPVIVLNIDGVYDGLIHLMNTLLANEFITPVQQALFSVYTDVESVLTVLCQEELGHESEFRMNQKVRNMSEEIRLAQGKKNPLLSSG